MTKKILIVDDESDMVSAIEYGLDDEIDNNIYEILKAFDGIDGWVQIKKNHPDLLLLDLSMPEMNGIDLLEKINNDRIDIKTIIISAYGTKDNIKKTLSENKAFEFLIKPFDNQLLKDTIEKAFAKDKEEKKGLIAANRIVRNLSIKQKVNLVEKILDQLPFNLLPKKYIISLISKLNELVSEKKEKNIDFKKLEGLDPQREKEGKIPIKILNKASLDITSNKYLSLRWRNNEGKLDYRYFNPEDFEDPLTLEIVKEKIKTKKKPLTIAQLSNIADYYNIPDLLNL